MLTVESLLGELDLKLAVGKAEGERPIRWVHISEIEDPTPWLNGGELLLTTGIQLDSAARQRAFVRLLAGHGLAGMGLGTGFDHKRLPKALVAEAKQLKFPLFEVPYEMPFIAITEKAFTRLVNDQYDVLTRGTELNERLERLVIEERGLPEVLGSVAEAIGGSALVLDGRGQVIARSRRSGMPRGTLTKLGKEVAERATERRAGPFVPEHPELGERALALPVPARGQGLPRAWLVVVRESGALGEFERLCARQAAIVVALELMRERTVRETERRLAGDVLAEALTGRLEPDEIRGRLRPFGIGDRGRGARLRSSTIPRRPRQALEAALADAGDRRAWSRRPGRRAGRCCARWSTRVPVIRSSSAGRAQDGARGRRTARCAPPPAAARRSSRCGGRFHEARCALEATSLADGDAPEVASHRDLGAFTLLLALQDEEALRSYSDSLLAPIEDATASTAASCCARSRRTSSSNGQWERAARELYCHRHTLRYRIRRVEELTGPRPRPRPRPDRAVARAAGPGAGPMRVAVLGAGGTIGPAIVARPRGSRMRSPSSCCSTSIASVRRRSRRSTAAARPAAAAADASDPADLADAIRGLRRARQLGQLPVQPEAMRGLPRGGLPLPRPRRPVLGRPAQQLEPRAAARPLRARPACSPCSASAPRPGKTNLMARSAPSASWASVDSMDVSAGGPRPRPAARLQRSVRAAHPDRRADPAAGRDPRRRGRGDRAAERRRRRWTSASRSARLRRSTRCTPRCSPSATASAAASASFRLSLAPELLDRLRELADAPRRGDRARGRRGRCRRRPTRCRCTSSRRATGSARCASAR